MIDKWVKILKMHCLYFTVNEIFLQKAKLGGGKFSEVFESVQKQTGKVYASKKIDRSKLSVKELEFLRDELQIVSQLSHPYVVSIKAVYES